MNKALPVAKFVGRHAWKLTKWSWRFSVGTATVLANVFAGLCLISLEIMSNGPADHEIYQRDPFEPPL